MNVLGQVDQEQLAKGRSVHRFNALMSQIPTCDIDLICEVKKLVKVQIFERTAWF
jgi:hypothetical protein